MARFTVAETELMKLIRDDRLNSTLAKIREAIEDLWPSDPVRIVQDYTDHGVRHSERVANHAHNILKANKGKSLSDREIFLLLAGIYLHDIGMQCDVIKFPKIAARAEEIGAKFDVKFELKDGKLSKEMQNSIRKNHQYISAAWIDHASITGDTRLGTAIKTEIPLDLIDDLMDICKYHSQLSIKDCPIRFKFFDGNRKQLVAAILRFADELDIDAQRVSIETVKNFSIEPNSSVYWWLHNRTNITFINPHLISITLQLHPEDNKQYGELIKGLFIENFRKKNEEIIEILFENSILLHISHNSKIKENDRLELLPEDIIHALKKLEENRKIKYQIELTAQSGLSYSQAVTNNVIALENEGRLKYVLNAYEDKINQNPNNALNWANKGIVLAKMGKYTEALDSFNRSFKLNPNAANNVLSLTHIGIILEVLGRYREAMSFFMRAIDLKPNYSLILNNKVTYLKNICKYKSMNELNEARNYQETEKEILIEIETLAIQNEEANIVRLMNMQNEEEAKNEFDEQQEIGLHYIEELVASYIKSKQEEIAAFLKKMDYAAREENAINLAEEEHEYAVYLETEKEILAEIEIKSLQEEESNILDSLNAEADQEEAISESVQLSDEDIYFIEKVAHFLIRAKEAERTAFLNKMNDIANEENAIKLAEEEHENAVYLETEKEILAEIEVQFLQKYKFNILDLLNAEADQEEANSESEQLSDEDIYFIEKAAYFLIEAKKAERIAFLNKMDDIAKEENAINLAEEEHEYAVYLKTENEILAEIETRSLQKEEMAILYVMNYEADMESKIEARELSDIDSYLAEEKEAFLNRMNKEARDEKDLELCLDKERKTWEKMI